MMVEYKGNTNNWAFDEYNDFVLTLDGHEGDHCETVIEFNLGENTSNMIKGLPNKIEIRGYSERYVIKDLFQGIVDALDYEAKEETDVSNSQW